MMKQTLFILICILLCENINAQYQLYPNKKGNEYFLNPIFPGDYPDPSLLRDGNDYYMVHSSFQYYPGLLIWHSSDLINWTPVTHALNTYVGSVWAPDIVKHKDKYYIYFPAENKNYVVWASSINGPWSDPIDLKISDGIDPGHVVDSNGNRYLYFNNGSYVPLSSDGLSVSGELQHAYDGWPIPRDWTIECFCLEGTKFVKRSDYYYLIAAQGGTAGPATGHMIVAARSKSPLGPWENSPYNPIIKTNNTSEQWCSKGHGTLFEDHNGDWWMVYHAYEKGFYTMGRQTMLQPIEWTADGWFKSPKNIEDSQPIKRPSLLESNTHYTLCDDFSGKSLKPQWQFFEEYNLDRFLFEDSALIIKAQGSGIGSSSPMLCIPSHHSYTAEVEMLIEGNATGGLLLFYNNVYSSGILSDGKDILANIRGWQFPTEQNVAENHVYLRLKNIDNIVDMYYSLDGEHWIKIENSLDVSSMHHNVLSGFMSLRIGLCAFGDGRVRFKNFAYVPTNETTCP